MRWSDTGSTSTRMIARVRRSGIADESPGEDEDETHRRYVPSTQTQRREKGSRELPRVHEARITQPTTVPIPKPKTKTERNKKNKNRSLETRNQSRHLAQQNPTQLKKPLPPLQESLWCHVTPLDQHPSLRAGGKSHSDEGRGRERERGAV